MVIMMLLIVIIDIVYVHALYSMSLAVQGESLSTLDTGEFTVPCLTRQSHTCGSLRSIAHWPYGQFSK